MSSTTRTRIWSAISLWFLKVSLDGYVLVRGSDYDERGTDLGRRARRAVPVRPRPGGRGRLWGHFGVTVSTTSGGSTLYVSTRVVRMTPDVSAGIGVIGSP